MKKNFISKMILAFAGLTMMASCSGTAATIQNTTEGSFDNEEGKTLHITLPEKTNLGNASRMVERISTGLDFQIVFTDEIVAKNHSSFLIETTLVEGSSFIDKGYEEFEGVVKPVVIESSDDLNYSSITQYEGSLYYGSVYKDSKKWSDVYDADWNYNEGYSVKSIKTKGRILKVDLDLAKLAEVPGCGDILKYEFTVKANGNAYASLASTEVKNFTFKYNEETSKFVKQEDEKEKSDTDSSTESVSSVEESVSTEEVVSSTEQEPVESVESSEPAAE